MRTPRSAAFDPLYAPRVSSLTWASPFRRAQVTHGCRELSPALTSDLKRRPSSVRTYSPKSGDVQRQWFVIDANDVVLGRLATQAATLLRGKHKPIFAPHVDTGDFVIIINAENASAQHARSADAQQAQGVRRPGAPPPGAAAGGV